MRGKILIALAVIGAIVLVFVGVIAMQPAEFRVVRTANMSAKAPEVFAQVNDFHNWEAWSPWAKLDPAIRNTYEGPSSGTGAIYTWAGNDEVGEGKMTITESRPSDLVRINLEFLKPFASSCITEFTFVPEGNQTAVTWSMAGKNTFVTKAVHLFMNMDKMIGGDFEKGLEQMKSVVEAAPEQSEAGETAR
jgi:Polyketide cyclase / dehydrase and lipid transport